MTCSSCVARVEKSLNGVDGVHALVNLATNSARVDYPQSVSPEQLIAAVGKTGYQATVSARYRQTVKKNPTAAQVDEGEHHAEFDWNTALGLGIALVWRMWIAVILTVPLIALAMVPGWQFPGWQWVSLVLATPVVAWCGYPIHRATFINLRRGAVLMDTLITMGTLAAYLWSLYALIFGQAGMIGMHHTWVFFAWNQNPTDSIYLETAAGVTTFILVGRYLEERSKRSASAALRALGDMQVSEVEVMRSGKSIVIRLDQLKTGAVFLVRPGQRVPADGSIVEGRANVDESAVTGESMPVLRDLGQRVTGGTVVLDGVLHVRATAVGSDTRIAQLARLVEDAQLKKVAVQRLADAISSVFVPVVIGIAVVTLILWLVIGGSPQSAFTAAVAVLVIACPCALGLATPVALMVGTGRAAQLGIVISGPEVIEKSAHIDTVVLDKTGTLTTGQMSVTEVVGDPEVLPLAAGVESGSEHPLARAIVAAGQSRVGRLPPVGEFVARVGSGVSGRVSDRAVWIGTRAWMREGELAMPAEIGSRAEVLSTLGATVVFVGWDGIVRGAIAVADSPKEDSAIGVARLRAMGLDVRLLTGDNDGAARSIAAAVGIDHIEAMATPEGKLESIVGLQADGHVVAMVGDGINDAAALAAADMGIAMGTGTDLARAASDMTLLRPTAPAVADALQLSRRTLRTIRGNLFWAFAYNVAAIPLAAVGLLNPMLAGAAMAFSSIFVVLNSLTLSTYGRGRSPDETPTHSEGPAHDVED